jgi:hypothetical protein
MTLPSTTGNHLYGMHMKVAIPISLTWNLNDESLADIVEGILAVGLNRVDGTPPHVVAARMARAFERSMQLLYSLAIRAPHVVAKLDTFEAAVMDNMRQRR